MSQNIQKVYSYLWTCPNTKVELLTFDLAVETKSLQKPNEEILYVHAASNHPFKIINWMPDSISNSWSRQIIDTI